MLVCGPRISVHELSLDGELVFYWKKYFFFLENDLESPLILKGKQNKKKKL